MVQELRMGGCAQNVGFLRRDWKSQGGSMVQDLVVSKRVQEVGFAVDTVNGVIQSIEGSRCQVQKRVFVYNAIDDFDVRDNAYRKFHALWNKDHRSFDFTIINDSVFGAKRDRRRIECDLAQLDAITHAYADFCVITITDQRYFTNDCYSSVVQLVFQDGEFRFADEVSVMLWKRIGFRYIFTDSNDACPGLARYGISSHKLDHEQSPKMEGDTLSMTGTYHKVNLIGSIRYLRCGCRYGSLLKIQEVQDPYKTPSKRRKI